MNLSKDQIVDYLRTLDKNEVADQARDELPDTVDTETDGDLLTRFGIDTDEILRSIDGLLGH